jgi:hypothetical protein
MWVVESGGGAVLSPFTHTRSARSFPIWFADGYPFPSTNKSESSPPHVISFVYRHSLTRRERKGPKTEVDQFLSYFRTLLSPASGIWEAAEYITTVSYLLYPFVVRCTQ